jgi:hypothetical protein
MLLARPLRQGAHDIGSIPIYRVFVVLLEPGS